MKTHEAKHPVIALSNESFKHYLIQRYLEDSGDFSWKMGEDGLSDEFISSKLWIQLFNRAKEDMENSGGRIMGYEVVDDKLVSHEGVQSQWPGDWMWVLQFAND